MMRQHLGQLKLEAEGSFRVGGGGGSGSGSTKTTTVPQTAPPPTPAKPCPLPNYLTQKQHADLVKHCDTAKLVRVFTGAVLKNRYRGVPGMVCAINKPCAAKRLPVRIYNAAASIASARAGGAATGQAYGAYVRRKQRLLAAGFTEQEIEAGKLASSEAKTQAAIGRKSVARSVAAAAAGGRATGQSYGAFKQREKRLLDAGYTPAEIKAGNLAKDEPTTLAALDAKLAELSPDEVVDDIASEPDNTWMWVAGGVLLVGAGVGVYYATRK